MRLYEPQRHNAAVRGTQESTKKINGPLCTLLLCGSIVSYSSRLRGSNGFIPLLRLEMKLNI